MRIRDIVVEHSSLKRLVGITYIIEKLGSTPEQTDRAMKRALQLYPSSHQSLQPDNIDS